MIGSYEKVLDKQIQNFYSATKKVIDNNREFKPIYPILMPDYSINSEYAYYYIKLKTFIWDHLISGVFPKWLRISGKKCLIPVKKKNTKYSGEDCSPHIFSQCYPFAFILEDNNQKIAYRYVDFHDSPDYCAEDKAMECSKKYNVNSIKIIDWTNTTSLSSKRRRYYSYEKLNRMTEHITLYGFLYEYFPQEICKLYVERVREAIIIAHNDIGFQTVSNLSCKHLFDFRREIIQKITQFDISKTKYIEFSKNGELTNAVYELLPQLDYETIVNRCFKNNMIGVLSGKNKFARCFMTSEHLYEMFKNDSQKYYDYSTVVSGYFKSVELLLEEAVIAAFSHSEYGELWIKANRTFGIEGENWRRNPHPYGKGRQIKFLKRNQECFSTEMGSLIYFLHENKEGWLVSEQGESIVFKCLRNYNQGCRNEHLHKDVITEFSTVESIRNNTVLCLLYILGGYKFYDTVSGDYTKLGGADESYNRLYNALNSFPNSEIRYKIRFKNQNDIMGIRLHRDYSEYDAFGNVINDISFAVVESFSLAELERVSTRINSNEIITININNMPERMWRIGLLGDVEEVLW